METYWYLQGIRAPKLMGETLFRKLQRMGHEET